MKFLNYFTVQVGNWFGIPLKLHWSWFLFMFFICWFNPYFGLITFVSFIFVIYHEYGHALTAKYFGIKCKEIEVYPIGGIAKIAIRADKSKEEFWITLMGPMVNFLFAIIFFILLILASYNQILFFAWFLGFYLNSVLFLFNLLPILPMDGGRLLRSFLTYVIGDFFTASYYSFVIAEIFCFILLFLSFYYQLWSMAIVIFVMFFFSKIEWENVKILKMDYIVIEEIFKNSDEQKKIEICEAIQTPSIKQLMQEAIAEGLTEEETWKKLRNC
jgi:Zn-dependent protease